MNTKKIMAILVIAIVGFSTMNAQEMDHSKMKQEQTEKVAYTCPMHSNVKNEKPGECSKCGMDLVKMDSTKKVQCCAGKKMDSKKMTCGKTAKTYTCSMHPEVISDKLGECPKCGMKLMEKKMEMNLKKEDSHKGHNN